jgi:hypothetical protein
MEVLMSQSTTSLGLRVCSRCLISMGTFPCFKLARMVAKRRLAKLRDEQQQGKGKGKTGGGFVRVKREGAGQVAGRPAIPENPRC